MLGIGRDLAGVEHLCHLKMRRKVDVPQPRPAHLGLCDQVSKCGVRNGLAPERGVEFPLGVDESPAFFRSASLHKIESLLHLSELIVPEAELIFHLQHMRRTRITVEFCRLRKICKPSKAQATGPRIETLEMLVECMTCASCVSSIMVGSGRSAELGIPFRKDEALQSLRQARIVAVDKTGTLTKGKPELTDFQVSDGFLREDVLAWVASIEALSEHPIAIVKAAEAEGLALGDVDGFEASPGYGVKGSVAGRSLLVGADRALVREGVAVEGFAAVAEELSSKGRSPLCVAVDGRLAAIVAVADPIKETTPEAIRSLHALGLEVAMITGDNRRTAEAVAAQLGIDRVIAEVRPEGKVEAVKQLREGGKVAFVGDGINDAPALTEADVGIAVGTGTDVVLMSGDLTAVVRAVGLSRATIRNIKQNLFWAFADNASLVPVAAGLLYPVNGTLLSPVFAAGAMAMSSVFVLGNALRLRRIQP